MQLSAYRAMSTVATCRQVSDTTGEPQGEMQQRRRLQPTVKTFDCSISKSVQKACIDMLHRRAVLLAELRARYSNGGVGSMPPPAGGRSPLRSASSPTRLHALSVSSIQSAVLCSAQAEGQECASVCRLPGFTMVQRIAWWLCGLHCQYVSWVPVVHVRRPVCAQGETLRSRPPHCLPQAEQWQDAASPDHSMTWGAGGSGVGTPFFTPAPGSVQRHPASQVLLLKISKLICTLPMSLREHHHATVDPRFGKHRGVSHNL